MKRFFKISLIIGLTIILLSIITITVILNSISNNVSLDQLDKNKLSYRVSNINICDTNGNSINKNNNYVELEDLNDYTISAFLSIEDKNFYEHNGLNYKRMLKALLNNIASGSFKEGASTISQQLVKNTQLSNDKTIERKIKEIYITQELEKEYSKDQILEMYLNIIYFGNSSYGLENASQNFFGKSANELTISESAMLAGVIKSPALYSPIYEKENCIKRRNLVLSEMLRDNTISNEQYNQAMQEEIVINENTKNTESDYSLYDYIDKAKMEAMTILNMTEEEIINNELVINTYLDVELQKKAYEIINNEVYKVKNSKGNICDGLVNIIDNKTNSLVAYASNSNYVVSNLIRQPGSAIKPILVYAPAIEKGIISPATKILDEKIEINGYSPSNLGKQYFGYVSVRDAVAKSLNIPAVKILQEVGIEDAKIYAKNMGIQFAENDNGYAIALGGFTDGVTLDSLTNSYTTFANSGYFKPVTTIKNIKNKYGMSIYEDNRTSNKVIGADTAFLMTSILQDGVKYGTSKRLNTLDYNIAGKTGTIAVHNSNQNTDAVSIAYTSDYTIGAWLGNYTLKTDYNLDSSNNGGTYATSVLKDCFNEIYSSTKPDNFDIPNSVTKCRINRIKYENENVISLATDNIDERYVIEDYFSNANLPQLLPEENIILDWYLDYNKNQVNISFKANKILDYEIIKVYDKKEIVLKTISNYDGDFLITDNNINYDINYIYYIKYKSKENKKYSISEKKQVFIEKPNTFILQNDNWLFS